MGPSNSKAGGPPARASIADVGGSSRRLSARRATVAAARISRPDQVLLILVVFGCGAVVGTKLNTDGGRVEPAGLMAVGAVVALIAVSVHAVNEFADVETDALTVPTRFSGGSGTLMAYGLSACFARRLAIVAGLIATVGAVAGVALACGP